jgi:hypothetical protein
MYENNDDVEKYEILTSQKFKMQRSKGGGGENKCHLYYFRENFRFCENNCMIGY